MKAVHLFLLLFCFKSFAGKAYLKAEGDKLACEDWNLSMDQTKSELEKLTNGKCVLLPSSIIQSFHFKCGSGNFLYFHEMDKCQHAIKVFKGEASKLPIENYAPASISFPDGYVVGLNSCFVKSVENGLIKNSIDETYSRCDCQAKELSKVPDKQRASAFKGAMQKCYPELTKKQLKDLDKTLKNKIVKVTKEENNSSKGLSETQIKSFNASEFDQFPKIEKGITKEEALTRFGKPDDVSDDGKFFWYSKRICKYETSRCYFYFDDKGKVDSWKDIKMEFTNNLK